MGEFVSLTSLLEPWFDKDRDELPEVLIKAWPIGSRQRAGLDALLGIWGNRGPTGRRSVAAQYDHSHDPANEQAGLEVFDLLACLSDLKADLTKIETGPSIDEAKRQGRRNDLRQKIADTNTQLSKLATDGRTTAGEATQVACEGESRRIAARSPRERLVLALRKLQDRGIDIGNHDRGQLQSMALKESGMDGARGTSKRTFERALASALAAV